jgi:hypothetical protein
MDMAGGQAGGPAALAANARIRTRPPGYLLVEARPPLWRSHFPWAGATRREAPRPHGRWPEQSQFGRA